MSKIISDLVCPIFNFCNLVMCILYTKFVKFLEMCKQFSMIWLPKVEMFVVLVPFLAFPMWRL